MLAQIWVLGMAAAALAHGAPAQSATAPALATTPYFRTLGVAEGLPSSDVREIVQDRDGYLWIGTADGLARYDGVSLKVYRRDANDPGSLSGNDIWALFVDRDNRIWCGGEDAGLNMLDARRTAFTHYRHDDNDPVSLARGDAYAIAQSADGAIWSGGYASGVNRLDPAGKGFMHFRHSDADANSLVSDDVFVLRGDAQGRMWIGGIAGVDVLDRDARVHHVDFSGVPGSGKINAAALYEEPDGSMLVGMRRGVVRVGADLRAQALVGAGLTDARIRVLARDALGELWIGTQHGLDRLALDGRLYGYLNDIAVPGSMPGVRIANVFGDREGAMWPAQPENSTISQGVPADVAGASQLGLRVLLVEDDATIAAAVIGLIEAQGHEVCRAAHGLAALSELAVGRFDAALIDFDLPGLDGLALARMLRAREATGGRAAAASDRHHRALRRQRGAARARRGHGCVSAQAARRRQIARMPCGDRRRRRRGAFRLTPSPGSVSVQLLEAPLNAAHRFAPTLAIFARDSSCKA